MLGDPVSTLIFLGLSGASIYAREQGAKEVRKQQSLYRDSETARQAVLRGRSRGALDEAINLASPEQQARQAADVTQGLESDYLKGVRPEVLESAAAPPMAGREVRTEAARRIHGAVQEGKEQAKRSAKLFTFPTQQSYLDPLLGSRYEDIDRAGRFSAGSSNVLGTELLAANDKAIPYGQVSDALGTVGDAFSYWSLTRKPNPALKKPVRNAANFGH